LEDYIVQFERIKLTVLFGIICSCFLTGKKRT